MRQLIQIILNMDSGAVCPLVSFVHFPDGPCPHQFPVHFMGRRPLRIQSSPFSDFYPGSISCKRKRKKSPLEIAVSLTRIDIATDNGRNIQKKNGRNLWRRCLDGIFKANIVATQDGQMLEQILTQPSACLCLSSAVFFFPQQTSYQSFIIVLLGWW